MRTELRCPKAKHRAENKCRLSLGESSVFPFFRGAKGDNKKGAILIA